MGQVDDAVLSFPDRFGNIYANGVYYPYTAQGWSGVTIRGLFFLYNATNPSAVNLHSSALLIYGDAADSLGSATQVTTTAILNGPLSVTLFRGITPFLSLSANWTGTLATYQTYGSFFPAVTTGANGTITNYQAYEAGGSVATGLAITNSRLYRCSSAGGGSTINTCFSSVEKTGATNNAAFHIDSNSATCGAGLVAGTAFDTCLYRGRAGAWTGPAGTDIYTDSGYICAGTGCSSVTSTNTGIYDAGVRVMSSVSCTGATCSLTNGALSITVSGGGGVTSIAGSSNQIVASASTGAVTLSLFGTSTAPTLASFGTGACTGGGTAPTITITGNTRSFYIVLVTGTGTCAADTVFTLNLGSTFSTKAICQLTDGLQNQGVSGFGVNRYIQTTTNQLILNSFTTVSPANNNLFAQLTQYEWHVTCGGY